MGHHHEETPLSFEVYIKLAELDSTEHNKTQHEEYVYDIYRSCKVRSNSLISTQQKRHSVERGTRSITEKTNGHRRSSFWTKQKQSTPSEVKYVQSYGDDCSYCALRIKRGSNTFTLSITHMNEPV